MANNDQIIPEALQVPFVAVPAIPAAVVNVPKKPRRSIIHPFLKDTLLKLFIRESRKEEWTVAKRNSYITALLKHITFKDLSRDQILRVFEQFNATKKYTKEIGVHVIGNTDAMINDSSKCISLEQMVGILSEIFTYFTLPLNFYGLPDKLWTFLHSCQRANHRNAMGLSMDLNEEEISYIKTFIVYFIFVLLKSYKNYWIELSKLEHGDKVMGGGSLLVFLGNLELEIKDKRDIEIMRENSIFQRRFYENTCMKALYTDVDKGNLYSQMNHLNAIYYPRYAVAAAIYDSRYDFKLAFLKLFETLCYNFYAKAVAMMKCMNTNNAVDYDNDDTDEVIGINNFDLHVRKEENNKFSSIHASIAYYVVGSAFNSMLSIFNDVMHPIEYQVRVCILENLTITLTQAIELNMPYSKIKSSAVVINEKTKDIRLICVSKSFFDCIVTLEEEVIMPIFDNIEFLATVGSSLYHFLRTQFCCNDAYSEIDHSLSG